jgi:hypothetical protein
LYDIKVIVSSCSVVGGENRLFILNLTVEPAVRLELVAFCKVTEKFETVYPMQVTE